MLSVLGEGSILADLQLHRTKCSSLILNVIGPALSSQIIAEIGNEPFSIIVDESTDIGDDKYIAYCVRYFNTKRNKMMVDFLGFQLVIRATAEQLHVNFLKFLKDVNLKPENMIALATDGANNMCGKNNSLFARLAQNFPNLQLLKCVCHSLNLCARKACEELPSNIEFLLRKSRAWFSHSNIRKLAYSRLYQLLNNKKPPKLVQLSGTRWLAFYNSVHTILNQWQELKLHFETISHSQDRSENSFTARTISIMFNDDKNLLYLRFLDDVLKPVCDLNVAFQANNADLVALYDELRMLLISFAQRIFKPSFLRINTEADASIIDIHVATVDAIKLACQNANEEVRSPLLPLDSVDYGSKFEKSPTSISADDLKEVKKRCSKFILRLCNEIIARLPNNLAVIEKIRYFYPNICMVYETIDVKNLPWELASNNRNKDAIEREWKKLRTLTLKDLFPNEDRFPEFIQFWTKISKIKTATGELAFENVAQFAIRAYSLPISNAMVERVFSVMGAVKTKPRNRLLLKMLNSIVNIRCYLQTRKLCCKNYVPTNDMVKLHNSKMYARDNNDKIDEAELLNAFELGLELADPEYENEDDY